MVDRETFYPNDRPILVFEARRPAITRFDDPDGVPAQPTDVWYRIFNGTTGEFIIVDGDDTIPLGLEGSYLYMSAMDSQEDRGALIYVALPPEMSDEAGNYTLYITHTYSDGLRITHDQRVQIADYR